MRRALFVLAPVLLSGVAFGQKNQDYLNRRQLIANVCPAVEITTFRFEREYKSNRGFVFTGSVSWKGLSDEPVTALEIVVLKYDPFNRSMLGNRLTFPGHNSANYVPLMKDETDSDGWSDYSEDVFTGIAFVYNVRFANGTLWQAKDADIIAEIKKLAPDIVEPGKILPPKKEKDSGGVEP